MSDEHKEIDRPLLNESIPAEMARLAERLAQVELPPSTLSRDELLYRAGWAAAEEQLRRAAPVGSDRGHRWSILGWSAASAVIAASLTVCVIWSHSLFESSTDQIAVRPPQPTQPTQPAPPSDVSPDRNDLQNGSSPRVNQLSGPTSLSQLRPREYDRSATLLIQRERALSQANDARWQAREDATTPPVPSVPLRQETPRSARELLKEFLLDVS